MNNTKLTKKLQVLLTEDEVREVNRVILNDALESETRPISVSAWIRDLIQRELKSKTPDQKSIVKQTLKNLKEK
jgi:plasmid stability protein